MFLGMKVEASLRKVAQKEDPPDLKGMKVTLIGSHEVLRAALIALLVAELDQPDPEPDPEVE